MRRPALYAESMTNSARFDRGHTDDLMSFLAASPSPYHAVANAAERLEKAGFRQIAVEIYGGTLLNTWLDRDLGLSGRVTLADGTNRLVHVDRALLRVPQLAVHLDRSVNSEGLKLDKQRHMTPIWGLGKVAEGD